MISAQSTPQRTTKAFIAITPPMGPKCLLKTSAERAEDPGKNDPETKTLTVRSVSQLIEDQIREKDEQLKVKDRADSGSDCSSQVQAQERRC